jgi:nucleotide-binding universal stress UspA family protein
VADLGEIGNTSEAVAEDIWIPLVDEPIGSIVEQLQSEHPEIDALVSSPQRILVFRTFAYIRVGVLLGQLLVDNDVPAYDGSETWIESLLREERHRTAVVAELRAVAEEIAADPRYANGEQIGPDDDTRARFREFARKQLG